MRDLDKRNLLRNDFLVVYGDVVSNLSLDGALAAHKTRRLTDKNAIMTMILRESGRAHRTSSSVTPVFVIDPAKDRCLHYEQIVPHSSSGHHVDIDPELLDSEELDIRADLIDCGIDICTPDSLALWSDNFDFQAPRRNFLHSVLKDYELNGKTIHTYIVNDHYAARVRDLHAYDSVSKDIVGRWAYPLCPDSNLLHGQSYRLQKGNIYKEHDVMLARSCVVERSSVIGKGTTVGEGTTISNSVIGRNCMIGRNVTIEGAYLWDSVFVGDGSTVTQAVLAEQAIVGKNCRIQPGALLSFSVRVSDGMIVQSSGRITRTKRKRSGDDDDEAFERGETDVRIVGDRGEGFQLEDDLDDEDGLEEFGAAGLGTRCNIDLRGYDADKITVYDVKSMALSDESLSTLASDDEFDMEPRQRRHSETGSFVSIASDDEGHAASASARDFHAEATTSLFDALEHEQDPSNIQLELSGLKLAANASEHSVRRAVISAFLKRLSSLIEHGTAIKDAPAALLPKYKLLLERTVFDKDAADAARPDQVDFLLILQHDCVHRTEGDALLFHFAFALSKHDVIETEGFEQWWQDPRSTESEEMKHAREKTQQLIDYILASDDEEDDDDSDEESE